MNYLLFMGDLLLKMGVYFGLGVWIEICCFMEMGDILLLYGVVNYDLLVIDDNWQKSEIGGIVGYFFEILCVGIKGGLKYNYWMYDNEICYQDIIEVMLFGELNICFLCNLVLLGKGYFIFFGVVGESVLNGKFNWLFFRIFVVFMVGVINLYLMLYQCYFYGNILNYIWINKIFLIVISVVFDVSYCNCVVLVFFQFGYGNYNKMLFFVGNIWCQDILFNIFVLFVLV